MNFNFQKKCNKKYLSLGVFVIASIYLSPGVHAQSEESVCRDLTVSMAGSYVVLQAGGTVESMQDSLRQHYESQYTQQGLVNFLVAMTEVALPAIANLPNNLSNEEIAATAERITPVCLKAFDELRNMNQIQ